MSMDDAFPLGDETDAAVFYPHPREASRGIGHEAAERQLLRDWNVGALPCGYMFCGPRGIGKATTAYRLARFILREGAGGAAGEPAGLFGEERAYTPPASLDVPAGDPVGRRVAAGSHSDLLTVEPAYDRKKKSRKSEIVAEDARRVGAFLSLTSGEGSRRMVIVDSADQLNTHAANALLKWLEEPPSGALFVLIAHRPGAVLPTLRSRCRMVQFRPPDARTFAEILHNRLPALAEEEVFWLFLLSGGRPGLAAALHTEGAPAIYRELLALAGAFGDASAAQRFIDRAVGQGSALSFGNLSVLLSRLVAATAKRATQNVPPEEGEAIRRLTALRPSGHWLDLWEKGGRLLRDTERLHLDPRQTLAVWLRALAGEIEDLRLVS